MSGEKFIDNSGSKFRNQVIVHEGSISVGASNDSLDKATRQNNALSIVVNGPGEIKIEARSGMIESLTEMDLSPPNRLVVENGVAVVTNKTAGKTVSVSSLLNDMTVTNAVGDGLDKKPYLTKDQAVFVGDKIAERLKPKSPAVSIKSSGPPGLNQ